MKTVELSGFGGGYEDMCQRMLWRGVAYLAEMKPPLDIWKGVSSYDGVYGLLMTKGDGIKALEAAIILPGDDVTGAMHQCVMGHLRYIHEHGTEGWMAHMLEYPSPDKVFEWSGDLGAGS